MDKPIINRYTDSSHEKIWSDIAGNLHRLDGPAYERYGPNNNIDRKCWYINGRRHRENGPAIITYSLNGYVDSKYYYLDDVWFQDDEEYYKIIELKNKLKSNKNLCLLNIKHKNKFIREKCRELLKDGS